MHRESTGTTPPHAGSGSPAESWSLAPGLRVVRRGHDLLQVGMTPDRRAVVPRDRHALELLGSLGAGLVPPTDLRSQRLLQRLVERGCVVPRSQAGAPRLVVGLSCSGRLPAGCVERLDDLGVEAVPATSPDQESGRSGPPVLVLAGGEVDRALLDPLVRDGVPHLVLRLLDGGVTLGPFVDPGRTACLRCLDLEAAASDPDHAAVLDRYVLAAQAPRGDAVPDGPDPALLTSALARAVLDLRRHHAGRQPLSWSATLRWTADADAPDPHLWRRHPRCGCGWLASWGTMGT